jgi:hypothetical protein
MPAEHASNKIAPVIKILIERERMKKDKILINIK